MKPKVVIAALAAVLVVGAGVWFAYGLLESPASDDAIKLVPEDSKLYGNVFLDPSNDQKKAIESIIQSTPFEEPERVEDKLSELFDELLKDSGCKFEDDIKPLLGNQVAVFATDFSEDAEGALLVATTDEDGALAAFEKCAEELWEELEETTYKDYDYGVSDDDGAVGTVNGYLVVGTEGGFKAVVDTAEGGPTLQDNGEFRAARARHSDDNIAFVYLDLEGLLQSMQASGEVGSTEAAALQSFYGAGGVAPLTFSLEAESKAVVIEYAAELPREGQAATFSELVEASIESDVVPTLPGASWGAIGIGSLGDYINTFLDFAVQSGVPGGRESIEAEFQKETGLSLTNDLLSWMGDAGLFIQGTGPPTLSGGLVLETSDEAASARAIGVLEDFIRTEAKKSGDKDLVLSEPNVPGVEGFAVQDGGMPQPVNVVVGRGKVVVAYGDPSTQQALDADDTLEDQEQFQSAQAAIGEDFTIQGYFAMDPIQDLVEATVIPTLQTFDEETFEMVPDTEAQERYEQDVKPFLDPLAFFAFGSKVDGDVTVSRLVVGVE